MSTLSQRLRTAMTDAGISQAELARRCGVRQPSVHGWLSGKSKFLRGENLLRAAATLNVGDQWLATGKGNRHRGAPADESQPVRLDPEMVRNVMQALEEVFSEELHQTYNLREQPELFVELYERTAAEHAGTHSQANVVWLGRTVERIAQQGAQPQDGESGRTTHQEHPSGHTQRRKAKG